MYSLSAGWVCGFFFLRISRSTLVLV